MALTSAQKKYLKGLAHSLKPVILIGQKGVTDTVVNAVVDALETHELIKVKFLDMKEKENKSEMTDQILRTTHGELVGTIGHTIILFKTAQKPENRKIHLPL